MLTPPLKLSFNIKFSDLYTVEGLQKLDQIFIAYIAENAPHLNIFKQDKIFSEKAARGHYSSWIIDCAPYLETFLLALFNIETAYHKKQAQEKDTSCLYYCKRYFVERVVSKKYIPSDVNTFDPKKLLKQLSHYMDCFFQGEEFVFAMYIERWLKEKTIFENALTVAEKYAAWALYSPEGQKKYAKSIVFKLPHKIDYENLLNIDPDVPDDYIRSPAEHIRVRTDFSPSDPGISKEYSLSQAQYCIKCHKQNKDSCSKGLHAKSSSEFQENPLKNILTGCPLEQKISEMNTLREKSYLIAALATAMIDNPMIAATGHRICNDCMKSCIFQKQEPVDVPAIESQILASILSLPWGFEIYSLLTRWNPLKISDRAPQSFSHKRVLICGLGPAGFTLSHYMLHSGHEVVAIDGLKIEPLPQDLIAWKDPTTVAFEPIYDIKQHYQSLDDRIIQGFGGVMEYGITVRWNKNYLFVIRLLLERQRRFLLCDGVRFGSDFSLKDVKLYHIDHVALCIGAGKPTVPMIQNNLAIGVKVASDFLMTLQLSGAFQEKNFTNLVVRMPVVIIGGGLTAIDTATEVIPYYIRQVKMFAKTYQALVRKLGKDFVERDWSPLDQSIAREFLEHATQLEHSVDEQKLYDLVQSWGGVTVLYRKSIQEAPSYRNNHEELGSALKEGIQFLENFTLDSIEVDATNTVQNVQGKYKSQTKVVPAKTVLFATGTNPNTHLAQEEPFIKKNGKYFQNITIDETLLEPSSIPKQAPYSPLVQKVEDIYISAFGDCHPTYSGSVVKAMASAKYGTPFLNNLLKKRPKQTLKPSLQRIKADFSAVVKQVNFLNPKTVEIVIHAPKRAEKFLAGQFFRLQNYQASTSLQSSMKAVAATGAHVDIDAGMISTILLQVGASTRMASFFKIGEPIIFMGPTGIPTEIKENEKVILVGGGLGNAVLFSIGKAFLKKNSKVLYFAGYRTAEDCFKKNHIREAASEIVWCTESPPLLHPENKKEWAYHGNVVEALEWYIQQAPGTFHISDIDRIIIIGSDSMMAATTHYIQTQVKPSLKPRAKIIASINSPMQCMMKEICGQCLQLHRDPKTGKETVVFSCAQQDQPAETVCFSTLKNRLKQNHLWERLNALRLEEEISNK